MTASPYRIALTFGLIILAIYVIIYTVGWQVDLSLFLNPLVSFLLPVLVFVLGVVCQVQARKALGGYIDLQKAIEVFVIAIVIGIGGGIIYNFLIFNVIDPAAKEELSRLAIEETMAMMNKIGSFVGAGDEFKEVMNEADLEKAMELQDASGMSTASLIIGFIISIVMYTIGGLISGLIIKKERPHEFE